LGARAQWLHESEKFDAVASKTKENHEKMSFVRSNGTLLDGRSCEHLLSLCTYILEDSRAELSSYQGSIGSFLVEKYREAVEKPDMDLDPELATQILEIFRKRQCAYYASDTMFDLSGEFHGNLEKI
jgi:hypothetical protein